MAELLACPFCRQLYPSGERDVCPECGLELAALHRLPPSPDGLAEAADDGPLVPAEDRLREWGDFGRGRGPLLLLALGGLACFFAPWIEMSRPELVVLSGFDLARQGAHWLFGGAVGFFVLLPLVWTRRTIRRMRGVRVIATVFAAMTVMETSMLLVLPPRGNRLVPVEFEYGWGLFASLAIGLAAMFFGATFGGKLPKPQTSPQPLPKRAADGSTLH